MAKSRILIIGAPGYLGKFVAKASANLGHPTFALVRSSTISDPAKSEVLKSLREAGVTLVVGDLHDHSVLVAVMKHIDVVVSTVGGQLLEQDNIVKAIKEVGTIKRFLPSEFGNDVDRLELDLEVTKPVFEDKRKIRRLVEESGIPYTFVVSGSFAGYYLVPVLQDLHAPPRHGKLVIYGDGNAKAIFNDENDIATFAILAAEDPRAENKVLHIIPKENVASQNEVTTLWEKKIGHTFEREILDREAVVKSIEGLPFPQDLLRGIKYSVFVKGDQTSFVLDPAKDVEATALYPDVKYTTIDEYLDRLV